MTPELVRGSNPNLKRALVTGGAGFIGSHLVQALLGASLDVLVVDDLSTGFQRNLEQLTSTEKMRFFQGDICSQNTVDEVVKFQPDLVLHQAAQMNVRRSVAEPVFDAQTNVLGTVNILEAARLAGTKQFLLASTGGAIYGEQESFPAPEDHPVHAECPYGVSKRAGELYLEYYARAAKMSCVALRYANVYGPRQNAKGEAGVVAIFSERMLAGQTLTINGDGEQTRDYVFVGDVVRANLAAIASLSSPGFNVYNVGRGEESSVLKVANELINSWRKHGGAAVKLLHGPALAGEQRRSVVDPQRIKSALGWSALVKIEEGLESTLQSFINAEKTQ